MSIDFHESMPIGGLDATSHRYPPVGHYFSGHIDSTSNDRLQILASASPAARSQVDRLLKLAQVGLPRMHRSGSFGHTLRAVKVMSNWTERLEGDNLRYASMVALGLSRTDEALQRYILDDDTAAGLARAAVARAETASDAGAVALAAWAAAEAAHFYAASLFQRLSERLASNAPIATVDCAWALIAALAGRRFGDTSRLVAQARAKLFEARTASGLFLHLLPASANGRLRSHIGCFADQVYPIQALSRLHTALGDPDALSMARRCADRICTLQGPDGQWWWHYDTRDGSVAEGYPVYSVHQHAMAPMALLELREAGGGTEQHMRAIVKGLYWLEKRPEVTARLVVPEKGVVWRKVARREPKKAARAMAAFTTAISPGLHMPGLDMIFPPRQVDYECRPYELGWLLYAWLSGGVIAELAKDSRQSPVNLYEEV